VTRFFPAIQHS